MRFRDQLPTRKEIRSYVVENGGEAVIYTDKNGDLLTLDGNEFVVLDESIFDYQFFNTHAVNKIIRIMNERAEKQITEAK